MEQKLQDGKYYTRNELIDLGYGTYVIGMMVRSGDLFVEMKEGIEQFKVI